MSTTTPWLRPLPTISPENAPFFAGLREHQFKVPRCQDCGAWNWTPYPACRACLSTRQEWTPVSGRATLHTFSIIHVGPKAFMQDGPYVWAFAKLEEGPRPLIVMGNLLGSDHADVRIDMPLRIAFHEVPGHDMTLYHFRADKQ